MKHLLPFNERTEDTYRIGFIKKPIEIRINLEAISHTLDSMWRHGGKAKKDPLTGHVVKMPEITTDDIKKLIDKSVEELTIALMQDRFSIYYKGRYDRFVIWDRETDLHLACELHPGAMCFDLTVVTVMRKDDFWKYDGEFVIEVFKDGIRSGNWNKSRQIVESVFVDKDEVDTLLDKIHQSGITSLSDIEKKRLTLFSEEDKEIISTIEKMGDITQEFKDLNAQIKEFQNIGKGALAKGLFQTKWMKLNSELVKLEKEIESYGIELGDHRLDKLCRDVRPDVYGGLN